VVSKTIAIAAAAKINLYLHVTGRRDDGLHELDSLIAFAAVHDTIALAPADDIELTVGGPFAGALADNDNLVLTAARRLAERANVQAGARIHLIKRLPVASGIGGGSADAAAALRGLIRLWGLDPGAAVLADLCIGLGADVPICFHGRTAHVGGIGELVETAPSLPETPMVLVNTGIAVSTPEVFARRSGPFSRPARLASPPSSAVDLATSLADRRNDLYAPACEVEPSIAAVVDILAASPGCLLARMSGSGATCFGLFAGLDEAHAAAANLGKTNPGWWVVETRLISNAMTLVPDLYEAGPNRS
jgi:4-diphosphocytidyl-2-C-methyl-D-erythritol kinase